MKAKDVLIMAWGKDSNGCLFKRQKTKFPKESEVNINFDSNRKVGKATNFRNTPKGIICDIEFDKKLTKTVAPKFTVDKVDENKNVTGLDLTSLSFVMNHANKDCEENLK